MFNGSGIQLAVQAKILGVTVDFSLSFSSLQSCHQHILLVLSLTRVLLCLLAPLCRHLAQPTVSHCSGLVGLSALADSTAPYGGQRELSHQAVLFVCFSVLLYRAEPKPGSTQCRSPPGLNSSHRPPRPQPCPPLALSGLRAFVLTCPSLSRMLFLHPC